MTEDRYQEGYVTSQDGLSLYYRDYHPCGRPGVAKEIPVLCLAGIARNTKDFALLAPDIAGGTLGPARRTICIDYRGRGRSDYAPDPNTYVPERYLDDIRHLRTALGIHQFIVVGSSMGGLLGMALCLSSPSALKGLVLNDIGPDIGGSGLGRIVDYLKRDRHHQNLDEAEAELRLLFTQPGWSDEDWRYATAATFTLNGDMYRPDWDPAIVKPLISAKPMPDLWRIFRSTFGIPVLALRGEFSDILAPHTLDQMAALHPRFTHETIPGAGHVPTLNEPLSRDKLHDFFANISVR